MNCPLADDLKNIEDTFNPTDEKLTRMILDHRKEILNTAKKYMLTSFETKKYKYFLEAYLQHNQIPVSMSWIILLINNIPNIQGFKNIKSLYIPDTKYLLKLIATHKSSNI